MTKRRVIRILAFFALLLLVIYSYQPKNYGDEGIVLSGQPHCVTPEPKALHYSPGLELKDLYGAGKSLKEFSNQTILLTFWAPWCKPCMKELPQIAKLLKKMPQIKIITVAVQYDNKDQIKKLVQKHGLTGAVNLLDQQGSSMENFGLYMLPSAFILDKDQIIRYRLSGERNWSGESAIDDLKTVMAM